jgi:Fe-S cluster assembly protein SufD
LSTNGVPEVLKSRGITAEAIQALSAFKEEPAWLADERLSAWRTFEKTPMPTLRDEAWRYTDISDVRIEDFVPYAPSPDVAQEGDLPEAVQQLIKEGEENSALLVQHNSETAYSRIDEELERKGVVFTGGLLRRFVLVRSAGS